MLDEGTPAAFTHGVVLHAFLVSGFGPVDAIEPIYVRVPDAEATLA